MIQHAANWAQWPHGPNGSNLGELPENFECGCDFAGGREFPEFFEKILSAVHGGYFQSEFHLREGIITSAKR